LELRVSTSEPEDKLKRLLRSPSADVIYGLGAR
jgi:hypothetical protein